MEPTTLALIVALIFSVVIHEMAHGYAANYLGDPTARLAGRLTGNPLVHLDPMMSVIVPGLLVFFWFTDSFWSSKTGSLQPL